MRNAVKLVLESRRGVFGSRFRVRVVAAYVGLALLPISLLILPTTGLLQKSVERWFAPPVENTIRAGRQVADLVRARSAALERRTADRLLPRLAAAPEKDLVALLSAAREESGVDYLEWRRPAGAARRRELAALARARRRRRRRGLGGRRARARRLAPHRGDARRRPDGEVALRRRPPGRSLVGTFEPPAEAEPIRDLGRATSAYAMLKAERASLEAIQVLLFLLLAFVVLLAAVWVGLLLARRVTRPIGALAASARRVGAGDFDALVEVEGGDEIGALSRAFNAMTSELRRRRAELVAANAELEATNRQLDEQRHRFGSILERLDAGVVAFWEDGRLAFLNDTARRLLDREGEGAVERLDDLLAPAPLAPLREFLVARARRRPARGDAQDRPPRPRGAPRADPAGVRTARARAS